MPDKIIYVHPSLPSSDEVTISRPKDLDALLEAGWEIVTTTTKRVDGKSVERYQLRKAADNRGVTVKRRDHAVRRRAPEEIPEHRGVALTRDPGAGGALVSRAGSNGGGSFLGGGSDFAGLPGVEAAGSLVIQHAFGMGTDAAHAGLGEHDCPWPAGTPGATQWLRGLRAARKAMTTGGDPTSGATAEAYEAGKAAGAGPEDIEIHCPYPAGTPHYDEWLRGFRDGGGTVED